MTETTLTTEQTPPETPETEPVTPAEAINTEATGDEHMIPKSCFDEVNKKLKRIEADQKKAEKAAAEAQKKALEEQNNFKALYEQEKAEREKALAEMTALQIKSLRGEIATKLNIPASLHSRIQGSTEEEIEADAKQLLQSLPAIPAPNLDSRAGGGKPGKQIKTEGEIREEAARLGVKFEFLKQQYENEV